VIIESLMKTLFQEKNIFNQNLKHLQ